MPTLPAFSVKERVNYSPHLVIVGAGASVAATPRGDRRGKRLPVMADFVDRLNLAPTMDRLGIRWRHRNFEDIYDELVTQGGHSEQVLSIENTINTYFASLELPTEATIYDYLLLCLREKDAIATFNWDPFLAQAFARNAHLGRLPRIYFLHGNVAIGYCLPCKVSVSFQTNVARSAENHSRLLSFCTRSKTKITGLTRSLRTNGRQLQ